MAFCKYGVPSKMKSGWNVTTSVEYKWLIECLLLLVNKILQKIDVSMSKCCLATIMK